jgi:hypothetical protein
MNRKWLFRYYKGVAFADIFANSVLLLTPRNRILTIIYGLVIIPCGLAFLVKAYLEGRMGVFLRVSASPFELLYLSFCFEF